MSSASRSHPLTGVGAWRGSVKFEAVKLVFVRTASFLKTARRENLEKGFIVCLVGVVHT
jgi:hypothetical protein